MITNLFTLALHAREAGLPLPWEVIAKAQGGMYVGWPIDEGVRVVAVLGNGGGLLEPLYIVYEKGLRDQKVSDEAEALALLRELDFDGLRQGLMGPPVFWYPQLRRALGRLTPRRRSP